MGDDWRSRMRRELKKQNKSLRQLSIEMKLSPDYAKILLQKQSDPSVTNFFAMADNLGVCPVWLFTGNQAQSKLSLLTDGQRELVERLIDELLRPEATIDRAYYQLKESDRDIVSSMIARLKDKYDHE